MRGQIGPSWVEATDQPRISDPFGSPTHVGPVELPSITDRVRVIIGFFGTSSLRAVDIGEHGQSIDPRRRAFFCGPNGRIGVGDRGLDRTHRRTHSRSLRFEVSVMFRIGKRRRGRYSPLPIERFHPGSVRRAVFSKKLVRACSPIVCWGQFVRTRNAGRGATTHTTPQAFSNDCGGVPGGSSTRERSNEKFSVREKSQKRHGAAALNYRSFSRGLNQAQKKTMQTIHPRTFARGIRSSRTENPRSAFTNAIANQRPDPRFAQFRFSSGRIA